MLSFFISYHSVFFPQFFQHSFLFLSFFFFFLPYCTPFISLFHASFSHPNLSIKIFFSHILFHSLLSCHSTVLEELFLSQVFWVKPLLYHLLDV